MATLTTEYQLLAQSSEHTFLSAYNGKVRIRLYAKYSGQSVANNTSLVYVKLTRYLTGSSSQVKYSCYEKVATLSGDLSASYSNSAYTSFYAGSEYTIIEQAYTVNHNADGSKSLTLRAVYDDSFIPSLSIGNVTCTLPTIPRASIPVLSDYVLNLGQTVSIYPSAASDAFRHTISYNWYSLENDEPAWVTIAEDVKDVVHWKVPVEFAENLDETDRGVGSIKCETYNGTTRLGTSIVEFEAIVPSTSTFWPTIESVLIDEPTNHMAQFGALVKGYSNLRIKSQAFPKFGATIAKYTVIVDGVTYEGEDITTDTLLSPDSDVLTVQVHAVDSRGIGSPVFTEEFAILDYVPPSVSALSVHRCNADGSQNDEGEYVSVRFTASIAPMRGFNTATYTLRYTPMGKADAQTQSQVVDISTAIDKYNLVDFVAKPVQMDGSYTWSIELEARDAMEEDSRTTSVSTAFTLMSWGPDGRSMGLGKVAEKADTLEVALNMQVTGAAQFENFVNFTGPVTGSVNDNIQDYVVETGTEAMGTNGTWYWSKWASGKAECYGCRNYGNMSVANAWGSGYLSPAFKQALPTGLFNKVPEYMNISINRCSGTGSWINQGNNNDATASSTGNFYIFSTTSSNYSQVYLGFHCISNLTRLRPYSIYIKEGFIWQHSKQEPQPRPRRTRTGSTRAREDITPASSLAAARYCPTA